MAEGYDAAAEDALLESVPWRRNSYRLFDISCLAGSAQHGVLSPLAESNALVMPRQLFDELAGLDERFTSPGGGLVGRDLYRRALALPGVQLVTLLGEASFSRSTAACPQVLRTVGSKCARVSAHSWHPV